MAFPRHLHLILALFFTTCHAISFKPGVPKQCESWKVSWEGGRAPFQLYLMPVFGVPINVSIPTDAKGSFTMEQLLLAKGQKFVAILSDADGFSSGSATPLMTVGDGSGSCNTNGTAVEFNYQLNQALAQCRDYEFSGYQSASKPVTIIGAVPNGNVFSFTVPGTSSNYKWKANAAAGTSVIFSMVDAKGRQGGASDVKIIGASDDKTCLDSKSPTTTGATGPTEYVENSKPGVIPLQGIIAIVSGSLLGLAAFITLGVFCLKQRRQKKGSYDGGFPSKKRKYIPLEGKFGKRPGVNTHLTPYIIDSNPNTPSSVPSHKLPTPETPSDTPTTTPAPSTIHYIVHEDIEATQPPETVIELPPLYSDRRREERRAALGKS